MITVGKKRPHDIVLEGRPVQVRRRSNFNGLNPQLCIGARANNQNGNVLPVFGSSFQYPLNIYSTDTLIHDCQFRSHHPENGKRRFQRMHRNWNKTDGKQNRAMVINKTPIAAENQDS